MLLQDTDATDWDRLPRVGDMVRLNDYGLEVCFGSHLGLAPMKQATYTLTQVDTESMTYPEPTYVVEVDDPTLNRLLISHLCFDLVSP